MIKWVKLGDIIKITSGGTPLTSRREYYELGTIPWVKTGDLKVTYLTEVPDKITESGLENSSAKIFPVDTVLLAMYGATIGNCSILKIEAATNQACAAFLPNEKVYPEYLYFYLSSIKKHLVGRGIGGGQPNISATILKETKFPLLPLPDQIRIATLLTRAEALIVQRKESLRLLDELVKGAFLEMFGDPSKNIMGFPIGRIDDLVSEVKYGTSAPASEKGEFIYLRMNNLTSDGYWDFSSLKFINMPLSDLPKYVLTKGDLVFNRTNSKELVGKTAIYDRDDEVVIAGYLIRVRTNQKANPWFIWGYLNSNHGKKTLLELCRNIVGMANINAQELRNIKIQIPPLNLQNQFATLVKKVESLKKHYIDSLKELENLYGSLSGRAFRGELDLSKIEVELPVEEIAYEERDEPEEQERQRSLNIIEQLNQMLREITTTDQSNPEFGSIIHSMTNTLNDCITKLSKSLKRHEHRIESNIAIIQTLQDKLMQNILKSAINKPSPLLKSHIYEYAYCLKRFEEFLNMMYNEVYTFEDLWESEFKGREYVSAKTELYQWLHDGFIEQIFDETDQQIKFRLRETPSA